MTKRERMLLLAEINHALPLGYRLEDTGAPRGERNYWSLMYGNVEAYGSFSLRMILKCVRGLTTK